MIFGMEYIKGENKMKTEDFDMIVRDQIGLSTSVLFEKAKQYATEDRLHNFRRAAELQGTTGKAALAGMMVKHTISVYDMCREERDSYTEELWAEKITDNINYLLLLKALITEDFRRENARKPRTTCTQHPPYEIGIDYGNIDASPFYSEHKVQPKEIALVELAEMGTESNDVIAFDLALFELPPDGFNRDVYDIAVTNDIYTMREVAPKFRHHRMHEFGFSLDDKYLYLIFPQGVFRNDELTDFSADELIRLLKKMSVKIFRKAVQPEIIGVNYGTENKIEEPSMFYSEYTISTNSVALIELGDIGTRANDIVAFDLSTFDIPYANFNKTQYGMAVYRSGYAMKEVNPEDRHFPNTEYCFCVDNKYLSIILPQGVFRTYDYASVNSYKLTKLLGEIEIQIFSLKQSERKPDLDFHYEHTTNVIPKEDIPKCLEDNSKN